MVVSYGKNGDYEYEIISNEPNGININDNCEKRVSSKPPIPLNSVSNAYVINAINATNKTIILAKLYFLIFSKNPNLLILTFGVLCVNISSHKRITVEF